MSTHDKYDTVCTVCYGIEQEEPCKHCDGYGYVLTDEGHALVEFLKRRGVSISISPRAEEDLANMLGE